MTDKFIIIASKMSSNRYLSAIRDAFIHTIPLTITAAFGIMINNVIFASNLPYALTNPNYWGEGVINTVTKIKFLFDAFEFGGLSFITLMVVMALPYELSMQSKHDNPFGNALVILGVFLALLPRGPLVDGGYWQSQWAAGYSEAVKAGIPTTHFGALFSGSNLFTALVVGVLFTEFFLWLQKIDALKITLPDSVPPAVAKSFTALIPAVIVFAVAGTISFALKELQPLGYGDLSDFISGVFQTPFLALAKTNIGGPVLMFIYTFFSNFLWVFGLHGPNILSGFSTPTLGALALENQTLYAQTGDAFAPELATFTSNFFTIYCTNGGSGATIGLLIAIFIFSKREDYKAIARLSFMPGLFEINEPITFGMPIVLNPILAIPFVIAPLACIILPGALTMMGVIPKAVIAIPWVMPPVINAFVATGANLGAAIVCAINIALTAVIYMPFVIMANKQAEKEAAERAVAEEGTDA